MKNTARVLLTVSLVLTLAASALRAQTLLFGGEGTANQQLLGRVIGSAGDVDGDGINDVHVANRNPGQVFVLSGATGAVIRTIAPLPTAHFPASGVSTAGDVDGDGVPDLMVSDILESPTGTYDGVLRLYSGATGAILYSYFGAPYDGLGSGLCAMGDLNADGHDDFAFGALGSNGANVAVGRVEVHSGIDGSLLWMISGNVVGDGFGDSIAALGDIDGDGLAEIVVGIRNHSTGGNNYPGAVQVRSGATGNLIYSFLGSSPTSHAGQPVAGGGDVDRDGVPDFIYGEYRYGNTLFDVGRVVVRSGLTGLVIRSHVGDNALDRLGIGVSMLGDVDGDGFDDYAASASPSSPSAQFRTKIWSGKTGQVLRAFTVDPTGNTLGVKGVGDLDGDGFADIVFSDLYYDGVGGTNCGFYRVEKSPELPSLVYHGSRAIDDLFLSWSPDANQVTSLTGTVVVEGAAAHAPGVHVVSLAPTRYPFMGIELLVATDPANLIEVGNTVFDATGEFRAPSISRQNPYLAGWYAHVQWFELGATLRSSNGLRLQLVP